MRVSKALLQASALATLVFLAAPMQSLAADFVPERVFAGRSCGKGTLKLLLKKAQPFVVESTGATRADGAFVLHQQIRFEGRPVESRTWEMRPTGAGAYTATLTDAAGPVVARTEGPRMTLRYPLSRWGLVMHQTLDLAEDGRTIANHGRIELLGLPFGHLYETIELGC